ncbi:hypothetical protein FIZ21_23035 [Salmonella enterica]|nr:hypothetical protein [Salmonella enterica]
MELIFYKRGKGRVTKSLSVYSDGIKFKLHYLTFDRTNPTKEERIKGEKEKRIKTLDNEYTYDRFEAIEPGELPHRALTEEFIDRFKHVFDSKI